MPKVEIGVVWGSRDAGSFSHFALALITSHGVIRRRVI